MRTSFLKSVLSAPALLAGAALMTVTPAALGAEQFYDSPAKPEALKLEYAAGISRHRLDGFTKVTGYRLSDTWYFGRQRGEDGGLALVWQGNRDQVSITTQGVRLTRRF